MCFFGYVAIPRKRCPLPGPDHCALGGHSVCGVGRGAEEPERLRESTSPAEKRLGGLQQDGLEEVEIEHFGDGLKYAEVVGLLEVKSKLLQGSDFEIPFLLVAPCRDLYRAYRTHLNSFELRECLFFNFCWPTVQQGFSWLFGKGGEDAARWWRHHPRAGDLLIGWVMHPTLTQGNKLDLEAGNMERLELRNSMA